MIGILGGYGEIGIEATTLLYNWGEHSIRIGGRNIEKARKEFQEKFPKSQWMFVDTNNDESIERFIDGCELIVNCVGPSYETSALVAKKSLEKGCHYVDVGFNKELQTMYEENNKLSAIYGAGAIPGLSGILPKWLSNSFDKVQSLICYTGILDKFTHSAAEDYLAGASKDTKAMAGWKDGGISTGNLRREKDVELPYFSNRVNLYPYFDNETQYLCRELLIENGEWYMAFEGKQLQTILEEVCFQFLSDRDIAVERLCKATAIDSVGKHSYINFLIEITGIKNNLKEVKTLILKGSKPSVLTGTIVGIVARAVLEGCVERGIKSLSQVSNLERIIEILIKTNAVSVFDVKDCSIKDLFQVVEGEI